MIYYAQLTYPCEDTIPVGETVEYTGSDAIEAWESAVTLSEEVEYWNNLCPRHANKNREYNRE